MRPRPVNPCRCRRQSHRRQPAEQPHRDLRAAHHLDHLQRPRRPATRCGRLPGRDRARPAAQRVARLPRPAGRSGRAAATCRRWGSAHSNCCRSRTASSTANGDTRPATTSRPTTTSACPARTSSPTANVDLVALITACHDARHPLPHRRRDGVRHPRADGEPELPRFSP